MIPLVSVPLRKTTVTGIVSSAVLRYSLCGSIHNVIMRVICRLYCMDTVLQLVLWDNLREGDDDGWPSTTMPSPTRQLHSSSTTWRVQI